MAQFASCWEKRQQVIYDYLNETTTRDPIADSYQTDDVKSGGMHVRPAVGGFFIKMLTDRELWKKWSSGDKMKTDNWAPLLLPTFTTTEVVPTSRQTPANWRYTTEKPDADWTKPEYDAGNWKEGPAGFGTTGTPGAVVRNTWNTDDIWLRRTFTIPSGNYTNLQFFVYHDGHVNIIGEHADDNDASSCQWPSNVMLLWLPTLQLGRGKPPFTTRSSRRLL